MSTTIVGIVNAARKRLGLEPAEIDLATGPRLLELGRALLTTAAQVLDKLADAREEALRFETERREAHAAAESITLRAVRDGDERGLRHVIAEPGSSRAPVSSFVERWARRAAQLGTTHAYLDRVLGERIEVFKELLRERWAVEGEPEHIRQLRAEADAAARQVAESVRAVKALELEARVMGKVVSAAFTSRCQDATASLRRAEAKHEEAVRWLRYHGAADQEPQGPEAA